MDIGSVIAIGILTTALVYLSYRAHRLSEKGMEMLSARSFPEYVEGERRREKPALSEEQQAVLRYADRIRDAESDPYSQG